MATVILKGFSLFVVVAMCAAAFPKDIGPFYMTRASLETVSFNFNKNKTSWTYRGGLPGSLSLWLHPQSRLHSELSAFANVNLARAEREKLGIPLKASTFAFSYPVGVDLPMSKKVKNGDLVAHEEFETDPNMAFFSVGGFMYFDKKGDLLDTVSLLTHGAGGPRLTFGKNSSWEEKWTRQIDGDLFHPITLPDFLREGSKFFMWVPPGATYLSPDEEPGRLWKFLPWARGLDQPTCPLGCFVYLSHHPLRVASPAEVELDMYFPLLGKTEGEL